MSQLTQPRIAVQAQPRPTRAAWIGAIVAAVAAAAVALVIAFGGGFSHDATPVSPGAQPSLRTDGGPEETVVATAIGPRPAPAIAPSESRIAAAIGARSSQASQGPDEARVAAAIAGR